MASNRFPHAPPAPVQIHYRSGASDSLLVASAHAHVNVARGNAVLHQRQNSSSARFSNTRSRQSDPATQCKVRPEPELIAPIPRPSPSILSQGSNDRDTQVSRLRTPLSTNWTEGHLDPQYVRDNYTSSSSGSDTDITVPSNIDVGLKMTPARRAKIVKMVDQSLSRAEKGADGINLAVGSCAKVKEVLQDYKEHCASSVRLKIIMVRELITLLFINLGYHRFPVGGDKIEPTYQDFVYNFSCTHKDFLLFLRDPQNIEAIQAQAHLSDQTEVQHLLSMLGYSHELFNLIVHDVTVGRAIEVIDWLKCSPPGSTFEAFGWKTVVHDPEREMPVFISALKGLLPPAVAMAHDKNDIEALKKFQSGSLSEYVKSHGCTQTIRGRAMRASARAYAKKVVNRKTEDFFRKAEKEGWIASTQEVKTTRIDLAATNDNLAATNDNLATTKIDLGTKLATTNIDLAVTRTQLATTNNNLETANKQIKRLIDENQSLKNSQIAADRKFQWLFNYLGHSHMPEYEAAAQGSQ